MSGASPKKAIHKEVIVPPNPVSLLESMRSIGYTLETALADIVDNSITAEASSVSIRFLWNEGNPWIAVLDDGYGMTSNEMIQAMRFGSVSPLLPRSSNDLGRFGLGLKTASISQCRKLTVASTTIKETAGCEWDLDQISKNGSEDWRLKVMDEKSIKVDSLLSSLISKSHLSKKPGTIVLWRNLDAALPGTEKMDSEAKFSDLMDFAKLHLETVFHRYLSPDPGYSSLKIDFNNTDLQAFNPFGPAIPARQELPEETVLVNDQAIKVQPFVLPHQNKVPASVFNKYAGEGGYLQNQGFYIYRNRRLILKATWFRLIKKEEFNKLLRVRVDIPNTLDHIWKINVDKSQVTPPEIVRKQLKKIIQRISQKGKKVFRGRRTTLLNIREIPIWSREVVEGKIQYRVNVDHPLIQDLISQVSEEARLRLKSCMNILAESFPKEVYYSDFADEETKFAQLEINEEDLAALCYRLMDALAALGLNGEAMHKKFLECEIPGADKEFKLKLLKQAKTNG
jgi:hypothetical protein